MILFDQKLKRKVSLNNFFLSKPKGLEKIHKFVDFALFDILFTNYKKQQTKKLLIYVFFLKLQR